MHFPYKNTDFKMVETCEQFFENGVIPKDFVLKCKKKENHT